jgi:hypothetical protein
VLDEFGTLTEGLRQAAGQLREGSTRIQAEVYESLVQLQFQDRVSQILCHVRDNVQRLPEVVEEHQQRIAQDGQPHPLDATPLLAELAQTYAMADERAVHAGAPTPAASTAAAAETEITFSETPEDCHEQDHSHRRRLRLRAPGGGHCAQRRGLQRDRGQRRPGRAGQAHRPEGAPDHQRREHAAHGRHHFLKAVKALPAYKFTPVIMLTTESQEAKKREGQMAGAKAWVVKPFQPPQLLAAVEAGPALSRGAPR